LSSAPSSLCYGLSVCVLFSSSDLRYGIKAAWSPVFRATFFNDSVNLLDKYTRDLDPPVLPFSRRSGRDDKKAALDLRSIDPEFDDFDKEFEAGRFSDADDQASDS
jgi:hypothetical protein